MVLMLPLMMFAQQSVRMDKPDKRSTTLDKYLDELPTGCTVVEKDVALGRIFFITEDEYDTPIFAVYDTKTHSIEDLSIDCQSIDHYILCPDGKSILLYICYGGAHAGEGLVKINKKTLDFNDLRYFAHDVKFLKNEIVIYDEDEIYLNTGGRYNVVHKVYLDYNGEKIKNKSKSKSKKKKH